MPLSDMLGRAMQGAGEDLAAQLSPKMAPWDLERPLYDVKCDAYWLVTRTAAQYRFVGPVALSQALLDMLPVMTAFERRDALQMLPYWAGPNGIVVDTR